MSRDEVHELFHAVGAIRFDEVPCGRCSLDEDIDEDNWELFTGAVRRQERPELPLDAIREAVVNAVAHRDYRSNASVHIYLFHDRLEVVSPGGLPPGMTEAELGLRSKPRNRLLFRLLHRMDAVEHIGTGVRRIRNLCREWDVAAPIFDVSDHWVTVKFPRPAVSRQGAKGVGRGSGRFDAAPCSGATLDDVDAETMYRFIRVAGGCAGSRLRRTRPRRTCSGT